jgi:purine nucleosidase
VRPCGRLGAYLHDYRHEQPWFASPQKGFFDLGDVAALLDPTLAGWEVVDCPEVDWDLDYQFTGTKGQILRCYHVDRNRTFGLLYSKLKQTYGED